MADITMCSGVGCPISHKCYRHKAKPDTFMQSYFVKPPYKDGECEMFWEVEEKKKSQRERIVVK